MTVMMTRDRLKSLITDAVTIVAIGTFLAILGPYNSHQFGIPWVWFYWTGLMTLGWAAGIGFKYVFDRFLPDWPPIATGVAMSFLVSLPVFIGVATIQALVGKAFRLDVMPVVFILVWVISAAVVTVSMLAEQRKSQATEPTPPGASRALTDKLPPRFRRARLIALEAEDHYLRVHTDKGDALILMRLSDALAAVETLDGARTHRSWWVARDAVETVERGDGRARLILAGELAAPVSRTYAPKLREAGWY